MLGPIYYDSPAIVVCSTIIILVGLMLVACSKKKTKNRSSLVSGEMLSYIMQSYAKLRKLSTSPHHGIASKK